MDAARPGTSCASPLVDDWASASSNSGRTPTANGTIEPERTAAAVRMDRRALSLAFALDTVSAARAATQVSRVVVVTSDEVVAEAVQERGADVVPEPEIADGDPLNAALRSAAAVVRVQDPGAAVAALLGDLKHLGMLDDTLIVWSGEFGRTPWSQGAKGRDHNPNGFTIWLAGAGVKGGFHYGATDDFGYRAVTNKVHVNDLHATLLHLAGLEHERLTYRFNGRDFRLTDVGGSVIHDILA